MHPRRGNARAEPCRGASLLRALDGSLLRLVLVALGRDEQPGPAVGGRDLM